ncbi:hypothetical protein SNEBB_008017, partial [Seison nebaliae]
MHAHILYTLHAAKTKYETRTKEKIFHASLLPENCADECSVCLGNVGSRPESCGLELDGCRHKFCSTCLEDWTDAGHENVCPFCRGELSDRPKRCESIGYLNRKIESHLEGDELEAYKTGPKNFVKLLCEATTLKNDWISLNNLQNFMENSDYGVNKKAIDDKLENLNTKADEVLEKVDQGTWDLYRTIENIKIPF